jgi:hypothetical protein
VSPSLLRVTLFGDVLAKATKGSGVSQSDRLRALVLVIVITFVPVLATLLAIVSTTEPDLSDLTPIRQTAGQCVLLNWFALRHGRFFHRSIRPGARIHGGKRPIAPHQ